MNNEQFYSNVRRISAEKGMTLYQLYKKCEVIPESTFFSMFQKNSTPKLDYIAVISRALNVSQGELLEPGVSKDALTPVQMELIETVSKEDEQVIRGLIPVIKGILMAEKANGQLV